MYPVIINAHLDSNATIRAIYYISVDLGIIAEYIIGFEALITILLSTLWGIYLIRKLITMSKIHKLKISTTLDNEKSRERNYLMNRNKNLLLLAVCICENSLMFNVIIGWIIENKNHGQKLTITFFDMRYVGYNEVLAKSCLISRVSDSLFITSVLSLIILVRITTQYLHSHYNFFEGNFRLKHKLIYFSSASAVIFGLGIFSHSIIIQSILYPILLITEYVVYIRTAIKLNSCLTSVISIHNIMNTERSG